MPPTVYELSPHWVPLTSGALPLAVRSEGPSPYASPLVISPRLASHWLSSPALAEDQRCVQTGRAWNALPVAAPMEAGAVVLRGGTARASIRAEALGFVPPALAFLLGLAQVGSTQGNLTEMTWIGAWVREKTGSLHVLDGATGPSLRTMCSPAAHEPVLRCLPVASGHCLPSLERQPVSCRT